MNNTLKLEVGKTYLDRMGREVLIIVENVERNTSSIFRFASDHKTYKSDGRVYFTETSEHDLITEKPTTPAVELSPHAELIKEWAMGAEIEIKSDISEHWFGCGKAGEINQPLWRKNFLYRRRPKARIYHQHKVELTVFSSSSNPDKITADELRLALDAQIKNLRGAWGGINLG